MHVTHPQSSSTPSLASAEVGDFNSADLKILRHVFPDGEKPDWYIQPENVLDRVKGFPARYQDIQKLFQSGDFTPGLRDKVCQLSSDFFAAWGASNRYVLEVCGVEHAIEMLERFANFRELFWDYEYFSIFDRLDAHITIYRGGSGSSADALKGFSWSLSDNLAQMFAGRSGDPVLLQAEVDKEDILLINFDAEMEIVPRPGSIRNVVQLAVAEHVPGLSE